MRNSKGAYEGGFADNMKHGEGTLKYSSGEKYVGGFCKNKRNGAGTLYDSEGNIIQQGTWDNDRRIEWKYDLIFVYIKFDEQNISETKFL